MIRKKKAKPDILNQAVPLFIANNTGSTPRVEKLVKTVAKKPRKKSKITKKNWFKQFIVKHADVIIISLLIVTKLFISGININGYPYFENDEATYSTRATTFIKSGELDHYTYWYDHAPAGWMFLGIFNGIAHVISPNTSDLVTGRYVMLGLSIGVVILTYLIGLLFFKSRVPAVLATIVMISSPLLVYYQRRILLDNIMIFWMLLSIWLIVRKPNNLANIMFSGMIYGIAALTKINALFAIPAMLLLVWEVTTHKQIRRHALVVWSVFSGGITSIWLLYAALKGELLPQNLHPETGEFTKISLIDTLKFQSARGGARYLPWDHRSNFYTNVVDWVNKDPIVVILSAICFVIAILLLFNKKWRKQVAFIFVIIFCLLLFMIRGGVVLGFYFIPILPFLALLIGKVIAGLLSHIYPSSLRTIYSLIIVTITVGYQLLHIGPILFKDETTNQKNAINWVINNIKNKDALIISDNYALPDLLKAGYKNVDYQFKVEYDPDIHKRKYSDDWQNGHYIILSHEVLKQVKLGVTPFVKEALDHATLLASFTNNSTSYLDFKNYNSTNGDWAQVYQIKTREGVKLQDSLKTYKDSFFRSYGQILDTETNETTAINQSMTLQMAVAENDRDFFDGVYQWTRDHLQNRLQDKLFSSKWGVTSTGEEGLIDANTTSLADVQTAYSLIEAYETWGDKKYLDAAIAIISDIQKYEIVNLGGLYVQKPYVSEPSTQYVINLGYADPLAYRKFAQVAPENAIFWNKTANDYYSLLNSVQNKFSTRLLPNWIVMSTDGVIESATTVIGESANKYGYEAFRVPYFIARDIRAGNGVGSESVERLYSFLRGQLENKQTKNTLFAIYNLDGTPAVDFEDIATNVSAISLLGAMNNLNTNELARTKILGQYDDSQKSWGVKKQNMRNQQFAWLYTDSNFPRLD